MWIYSVQVVVTGSIGCTFALLLYKDTKAQQIPLESRGLEYHGLMKIEQYLPSLVHWIFSAEYGSAVRVTHWWIQMRGIWVMKILRIKRLEAKMLDRSAVLVLWRIYLKALFQKLQFRQTFSLCNWGSLLWILIILGVLIFVCECSVLPRLYLFHFWCLHGN